MDKHPFISAIEQICEEKGISRDKVIETIEMAIAAAYKKEYGKKGQIIRAKFNKESGDFSIFQVKLVVDESMIKSEQELEQEAKRVEEGEKSEEEKFEEETGIIKKVRFNLEKHIMFDEAKKIKKNIKIEDELLLPLETYNEFGRIAAQTAKQVIIQRIREAEREAVFDDFKSKEGEVISGVVQRIERGTIFLDIGRAVGVLFPEEQIPGEYYRIGQRLRVLVLEVQKDPKGPSILLSRAHPKLILKLFELEVPEISAGTVEIKAVAREAGSRSKIAVVSHEEGVDPIGSCVGQRGTRVQAVINELSGEKIDIIEWSSDIAKFVANALAPAKVLDVDANEKENIARVRVPDDQLSLAIGKKGQNVRLAAKLTSWKIDVLTGEGRKPEGIVEKEKEIKESKDKKVIESKEKEGKEESSITKAIDDKGEKKIKKIQRKKIKKTKAKKEKES